jgi:hypothetical protein
MITVSTINNEINEAFFRTGLSIIKLGTNQIGTRLVVPDIMLTNFCGKLFP